MMDQQNVQYGRVGVLMGGYSSERAISLKSGRAVVEALTEQGCNVVPLDIVHKDPQRIKAQIHEAALDVAFIALHGHLGEDGVIQEILDDAGLVYTGSGVEASRAAINKINTHQVLAAQNIRVPTYQLLNKNDDAKLDGCGFEDFPLIVKPPCEGSSIGIRLVRTPEQLVDAVKIAWQYDRQVLIEHYIDGREMTVGILKQRALPVIEIISPNDFFDFSAKYQAGKTRYQVPASIAKDVTENLQSLALRSFSALGCEGMARVDFMLSKENIPYVLEVNTIPGFTATSLLPKAAAQAGLNFGSLCIQLIEMAYGKKKEKTTKISNNLTTSTY